MHRTLPMLLAATLVAGCGFKPEKILTSYTNIQVREVGRSLYCNSPGQEARAQLLSGAAEAWHWQESRGINLVGPESLANTPHAIIEMGTKPTGGFGLAVSRAAVLRGELVILSATFVNPGEGSLVTQALTSPCVLVELPAGRYRTVEVQDPGGAVRATGTAAAAPATPDTAPPLPSPPN